MSLKNVLASSPRTIWVPRANCRLVSAGGSGGGCSSSSSDGRGRRGRFSKLDASRQEALTRTLRGLSAGARRLPLAGLLRAALRRRASLSRMRHAGPGAEGGQGGEGGDGQGGGGGGGQGGGGGGGGGGGVVV